MNKQRRKAIEHLRNRLDGLKLAVGELRNEVEALRDDEQEYYDNMPQSFQDGEKGQAAEAAVSSFDEALSAMDEIESQIGETDGHLEQAAA